MVELRLERRQSEGLKRFEAALKMPIGYYWGCKYFLLIQVGLLPVADSESQMLASQNSIFTI
jgi:hypothetical protein